MVSGNTGKAFLGLVLAGFALAGSPACHAEGLAPAPAAGKTVAPVVFKIDRAIVDEYDARYPGVVIETYRDDAAQAKALPAKPGAAGAQSAGALSS